MEDRGLKINRSKTVTISMEVGTWMETQISIYRDIIWERVNTFKYLGATLADNGDLDAEMTHRIQSGWKTGRGY